MNRAVISLVILFLVSCGGNPPREDDTVRREVTRQVETARVEMRVESDRRFTLRIVAWCLLAGGSIIGLFRLGNEGEPSTLARRDAPASLPDSRNERLFPSTPHRVIQPLEDTGSHRH